MQALRRGFMQVLFPYFVNENTSGSDVINITEVSFKIPAASFLPKVLRSAGKEQNLLVLIDVICSWYVHIVFSYLLKISTFTCELLYSFVLVSFCMLNLYIWHFLSSFLVSVVSHSQWIIDRSPKSKVFKSCSLRLHPLADVGTQDPMPGFWWVMGAQLLY